LKKVHQLQALAILLVQEIDQIKHFKHRVDAKYAHFILENKPLPFVLIVTRECAMIAGQK
jgi:hypothetical protein